MSGAVHQAYQEPNETWLIDISVSTTVSNSLQVGEWASGTYELPSTFDGTAVTFQGSIDNVTFDVIKTTALVDRAADTVAAADVNPIPPEAFAYRFVRIVTSSAQTTTDTIIKVFLKG